MVDIAHKQVQANGISLHVAEAGDGPLVLLCHGFPELWYSWRHQIDALAAAGYRVVAPDQRGYGGSDRPEAVGAYTLLHLVGDMVGLLDALGEESATIVGHDWGSMVAWNAALLRPDRFPAVVGMSVPYAPRTPVSPLEIMKAMWKDRFFYMLYFQEPGKAEAELEADVARTMRMTLYSASGSVGEDFEPAMDLPVDSGFLDMMVDPAELPDWLGAADLAVYTEAFETTGFRGGLNWYRNWDRNWELMGAWNAAKVTVPALFVAGKRDVVVANAMAGPLLDMQATMVPDLRDMVMIDGAGHWVQQEAPDAVNTALVEFLSGL
ncbi:MAG: alpha/beta hydrolase [Acidimicrobiia bacterium]